VSGYPPFELGYPRTELRRELVAAVLAGEIELQFARDEGEGFESVEEWRLAHERFFRRPDRARHSDRRAAVPRRRGAVVIGVGSTEPTRSGGAGLAGAGAE
jgi:hypothetical protein